MYDRYKKSEKIINNSEEYSNTFKEKNVKNILQYSSYDFKNLKNIEDYNLEMVVHTVEPFEKLYMISQKYYGSPEYGWLICYTNKLSNELSIGIGTVLNIYFPLEEVLGLL